MNDIEMLAAAMYIAAGVFVAIPMAGLFGLIVGVIESEDV